MGWGYDLFLVGKTQSPKPKNHRTFYFTQSSQKEILGIRCRKKCSVNFGQYGTFFFYTPVMQKNTIRYFLFLSSPNISLLVIILVCITVLYISISYLAFVDNAVKFPNVISYITITPIPIFLLFVEWVYIYYIFISYYSFFFDFVP